MQLVITGGLGFLGIKLAQHFLRRGALWSPKTGSLQPLRQLTLFDIDWPDQLQLPPELTSDERVRIKTGDITMDGVTRELVHGVEGLQEYPDVSVIHLASMVSGDSEADPDRAWEVNVGAQRSLLEAIRHHAPGSRLVFTSSTATFGPINQGDPPLGDMSKQLPQNTYGFKKVVCEMLINEYSRRGWVDGRGLRLPVIVVRPGAPNAALTTCWSSAVREPLKGEDTTIPIPGGVRLPVASYQMVCQAMEHALLDIDGEALGHDRTLTLPSLSLSPLELHQAAQTLAEEEVSL